MALVNFSGIASGIDSSSLIKALLDKQRAGSVKPLENKITSIQDRGAAFDSLSTLLEKLKSASAKFRTVNGGPLTKISSSSDETVATATATSAATNGSFTLTTSQLAKNATQSFNDRFGSSSSVINATIDNGQPAANRTVTYTIGTGADTETVNVELTNATTLDQFVTAFNAEAENASASVVNVGTTASPSYAVVVTSNNQGTAKGQVAVSVGSEITSKGSFTGSTVSQATNASFTVSGVTGTISRASNSVSDVIPGVNLTMTKTGTTTITVGDDAAGTTSALQEFVDAYNEVISFVSENDQITEEENNGERRNVFGPLADTSIDENLLSALREGLSGSTSLGSSVAVLSDLGISTQRDGTLAFNSDTFAAALANDSVGTQTILASLGERFGATGGTVDQYTRFNGILDAATRTGDDEITRLNDRIAEIEKGLAAQEQTLTTRFARLESLIGRLNNQQSSLSSILPG